ncbi:Oligoxyloglucan reducing end-specific cellobiohydrolase [Calocera viscosa TUFC12733]|uniref:Vacuolar protein sorting/targeting protein 10 n=1 Tax=Calocera viscosa (strain TUFC12733) TaxID=1330018 RepID=A0A167ISS5_CALVF|nr:Oligoxyloglucan reducing end-specific cellobiohydrolase [Calocera viscosa TUFC12733]
MLSPTSRCVFARSTKDFKDAPEKLVLCVAFDSESLDGTHAVQSSRLYTSEDFFETDGKIVNFGRGKQGRGVVALGVVSKFIVVALKDLTKDVDTGEMVLYVTIDGQNWAHASFPHGATRLLENAYTVVESTTHSLAVDVLTHSRSTIGTLFVSNSNGTFFVQSLKDTNRNMEGFVDFEELVGVEGVGLANYVANADEVEGRGVEKQLRTVVTFDDGSSWDPIATPSELRGEKIACPNSDACNLHLHSVSTPHNLGRIFSSPAPGFVMGVGSAGDFLLPYEQCDTFLSTDAGVNWKKVSENAHMYEFGGQGSIIVIVDDEDYTDYVQYSYDSGNTWHDLKLGVAISARGLTTVPDSTSQKFLLLGTLRRQDQTNDGRHVGIFLDFAPLQKRQCGDSDFERWYARTAKGHECVMGHKQYYRRRKADADCFVGHKFEDPVEFEENCACSDHDYECDYNYVLQGGQCVAAGPEPIPAGVCSGNRDNEKYKGSSGYRLIPGNTCDKTLSGAVVKDDKVDKDCSNAAVPEGEGAHQTFQFPAEIMQHFYFRSSQTVLVQLHDHTVWQSPNEGYSWTQLRPDLRMLAIYMHNYADDRAYIITDSRTVLYTTSTGKDWYEFETPTDVNNFRVSLLQFHPSRKDWLIWTGQEDCLSPGSPNCRVVASYSLDNGRRWHNFEEYVKQCTWGRDKNLKIDERLIVCESFGIKSGSQREFGFENPLQLVAGRELYTSKTKLFENVVGLAKFSEYMIVAELGNQNTLDLQVSLDGKNFATGLFPMEYRLDNHAYTILESSTDSVFLHVTMSQQWGAEYGSILKSNSNGTYYGVSLDFANRNDAGYVDFEKNQGLDGIAVANVVVNPDEALLTGKKYLQTRITHNDGGSWKQISPPTKDSLGQTYDCTSTKCALNIHGYTERRDARATYSSPAATGLMMAVGNVGESLASYTDSDIFLSRDAGFTWEEVHKDAHLWEFGDSGSVLVIVNDEEPTDHVLFTTDEGLNWREYHFGDRVRIMTLVNAPSDTSRKFLMFGTTQRDGSTVAIHLDFTQLSKRQCACSVFPCATVLILCAGKFDIDDPNNDDFELWSPSEEREEQCLFGRQVAYYRRLRDKSCYIGDMKPPGKLVRNCICKRSDFECEFNHRLNDAGECILAEGASPLPSNMEDQCWNGEEFWWERTAYRKIPFSTCEDGERLDQGHRHECPGLRGKSVFFWLSVIVLPAGLVSVLAYWFYKKSGHMKGTIRLPDNVRPSLSTDAGLVDTIASVPWYLLGLATVALSAVSRIKIPFIGGLFRSRRGYRTVAVDEDAQVLRFEDEEGA